MRSLVWIALAAAAAGTWLHDAVAQTAPRFSRRNGPAEPVVLTADNTVDVPGS